MYLFKRIASNQTRFLKSFTKLLQYIGIFILTVVSVLFLILFMDQLAKDYIRSNMNLPTILRRFGIEDNQQFVENYNKRITEHKWFDMLTKKSLENLSMLSENDVKSLAEICNMQIAVEQDKIYLAKAFNCIGQINKHHYDQQDNVFKAIKNFSYSLEVAFLSETYKMLFDSIVEGFQYLISPESNFLPYFTGNKEDEINLLNKLMALNIPEITARANYRLSLIHKLGRASAKEDILFDLKSAVNFLHKARKDSNIIQDNIVNIAITINNKFADQAATAIASALVNADLSSFYRFYIISDLNEPVTNDTREKLMALKWIADYDIIFVNLTKDFTFSSVISEKANTIAKKVPRFPTIINYRLYLDKILPQLDKILYLDADILVLEDLAYFNTLNLDNYFLAGVLDAILPCSTLRKNCSLAFQDFYINSGVILFNLDKMRKENAINKMEKVIQESKNCDFEYPDQDVINLAFENSIYYLSVRWNDLMINRFVPSIIPEPISFIQHYAGGIKPKSTKISSDKNVRIVEQKYFEYRNLTAWANN